MRSSDERGVHFRVWAPNAKRVEIVFVVESHGGTVDSVDPRGGDRAEEKHAFPMENRDWGYFERWHREAEPGDRYRFRLDGERELPDPASRSQPDGVHGPSQVVARDFPWTDGAWRGLPLETLVIYELHVGTFTPEGTFDGVRRRLGHIKSLGVNAVEIMPVAQFPGARNWGYDGVGVFAVQNSYGGSEALKRLVDECHREGLVAILDVVHNHLGPEGNYLANFGPYFHDKYRTPWGGALNFDGEWSDEVRRYFLASARQWLEEFHFDGLRLDAVHAIFDASARPFLEDLGRMKEELQEKLGRRLHLIAESDANDSRLLHSPEEGGLGMDGQWADDFHHSLHALLTGERQGYYADYGRIEQLAEAYRDGVVYDGEYSVFRHRSHGRSYRGIARHRLVVYAQNHDQIGNRMNGERLTSLVGAEKQRLAAACVFLSPYLPLIFMGEEYGETAPFPYFVDHGDLALIEAVRQGRRKEFAGFGWRGEPPDPASPATFERARLKWENGRSGWSGGGGWSDEALKRMAYYRRLIALSKWIRSERLLEAGNARARVLDVGPVLEVSGYNGRTLFLAFFNFGSEPTKVKVDLSMDLAGPLEIILRSWDDLQSLNLKLDLDLGLDLDLKPFAAVALCGATQSNKSG